MQVMVVSFLQQLCTVDSPCIGQYPIRGCFPTMDSIEVARLRVGVTME